MKKLLRKFRKQVLLSPRDEYVERLLCTVPGMMDRGNIYLMDFVIKNLSSNLPILEIGSFSGLSACLLRYLLDKYQKQNDIICVDPFIYEGWMKEDTEGIGKNKSINRVEYLNHVKASFKNNTSLFCKHQVPFLFEMTSDEFFKRWSQNNSLTDKYDKNISGQRKFSFCFVDGGHSYNQTMRDLKNCATHSERLAFVLVDDSDKHSVLESSKATFDFVKSEDVKIVKENPHVLLQIKK